MIIINEFKIIDNGSKLSIKLETDSSYFIESILIWDMYNFKDYSLATDLSYKIEGDNNIEEFEVDASELDLQIFKDIYFIEVRSTAPIEQCPSCLIPALGITYDLSEYYTCLINFLNSKFNDCLTCEKNEYIDIIININLLIDSIKNCIEVGYYLQAISFIEQLKKICSLKKCTNCKKAICTTCNNFIQIS